MLSCSHLSLRVKPIAQASCLQPSRLLPSSYSLTFRLSLLTQSPLSSTTTTTTTLTITGGEAPAKRDAALGRRQVTVIPSLVPAYATYCTGTSAYSSACSCLGITAMTTFAPTPTATSTVTATATVCPAGQSMCSTGCADLTSNDLNCGSCGNAVSNPYSHQHTFHDSQNPVRIYRELRLRHLRFDLRLLSRQLPVLWRKLWRTVPSA